MQRKKSFLLASLRYEWQKLHNDVFKVYNVMTIYICIHIYTLWNEYYNQINLQIHHLTYAVGTSKILANFKYKIYYYL